MIATTHPVLEHAYRFSVAQYQDLVDEGRFPPDARLELIDGIIVVKMTQNPPHAVALDMSQESLRAALPKEWRVRERKPIVVAGSQPEPDLAVVKGPLRRYASRHPQAEDIGMLLEVSDTTLEYDRDAKGRVYAAAHIPDYWFVNLIERTIEVYTEPRGGKKARYENRQVFAEDDMVPLVVAGKELTKIPACDLLPPVQ